MLSWQKMLHRSPAGSAGHAEGTSLLCRGIADGPGGGALISIQDSRKAAGACARGFLQDWRRHAVKGKPLADELAKAAAACAHGGRVQDAGFDQVRDCAMLRMEFQALAQVLLTPMPFGTLE